MLSSRLIGGAPVGPEGRRAGHEYGGAGHLPHGGGGEASVGSMGPESHGHIEGGRLPGVAGRAERNRQLRAVLYYRCHTPGGGGERRTAFTELRKVVAQSRCNIAKKRADHPQP